MIYKTLHMKLKIEQQERHKKQGVNLDSPKSKDKSCSTSDTCDVTLLKKN